jgi:hypothetical protein
VFIKKALLLLLLMASTYGEVHKDVYERKNYSDSSSSYMKYETPQSFSEIIITSDSYIYFNYAHCIEYMNLQQECGKNYKQIREMDVPQKAALSFMNILKHFQLSNAIRTKKTFIATYYEHNNIPESAFIRHLNEDKEYPKDIRKVYEKEDYFAQYEMFKKKIYDSKLHKPLMNELEKIGCTLVLDQYFTDGWEIKPKKFLIDKKFFRKQEAKKDFYPLFKQAVIFELKCRGKKTGA